MHVMMALISGFGASIASWADPVSQLCVLKLCAGAVVGEGCGAPVYVPVPSDQLLIEKHTETVNVDQRLVQPFR